jgi:hypothetical protein
MSKPNFLDYDKKYDILYIGLGDRSNSFGDEASDDLTVMRSSETNEIVGLIVWDFGNKYRNNALPAWPEDVKIDVASDILPQIDLSACIA